MAMRMYNPMPPTGGIYPEASYYSPFPMGQLQYPFSGEQPAPPLLGAQNPDLMTPPPGGFGAPPVSVMQSPYVKQPGFWDKYGKGMQTMGLGLAAAGMGGRPPPPSHQGPVRLSGNPGAVSAAGRRFSQGTARPGARYTPGKLLGIG